MTVPDLCIYFVIGILSVAYPILLQVIATLDEKYASTVIVELFKKEREYYWFRVLLVGILILIGCYGILNLTNLLKVCWVNYTLAILMLLVTGTLIAAFLLFIGKILTYYTPSKIVTYFIQKEEDSDFRYFNALGDILYFSIDHNLDGIAKQIHEYYYKAFAKYRQDAKQAVIYPDPYYNLIRNIVSRLAQTNNPNFRFLEHRTIGGIWLLGELSGSAISEQTYGCLWYLLTVAVRAERDDMVMLYWATAHQHFVYQLPSINENYSNEDGQIKVLNQAAVDKRKAERERFLEFNHALGGLLLFKNRIACIRRTFSYTSSTPPNQELLPLHMTQVFQRFFKFWDAYHDNFPFITHRYWYPDTEGINSEDLVKVWTCKYAAVLLLRQYKIIPYYVYMRPLDLPAIPDKKSERRLWIDNLDYFKKYVEEAYANKALLADLGMDFLNDEWLAEQHKIRPVQVVCDTKIQAEHLYQQAEIDAELSEEEVNLIKENSAEIMADAFAVYKGILDKPIVGEYNGYQLGFIRTLMEKSAFVADKDADHLNHHSIIATSLARELHELVAGTFDIQPTVQYRLDEQSLFAAVDRLNLNPTVYVIINFGFDLQLWIDHYKVANLSLSAYNGIEIIHFPGNTGGRKLSVLKREDMPYLFTKKPEEYEINENELELIGEPDVYFSIRDLNIANDLRNRLLAGDDLSEEDRKDIRKHVQIYLTVSAIIRWSKTVHVYSLSVKYIMAGDVPNHTLEEISPVSKQAPKDDPEKGA